MLNYEYVTTTAGLKSCLKDLESAETLSLDIETTSLHPPRGCPRLIQVATTEKQWIVDIFRVDSESLVKEIGRDKERTLIVQFSPFETEWFYYHFGEKIEPGQVFDTCFASRILNEKPAKLQNIVSRYLRIEMEKEEQLSDWSQPELSKEQLRYAAIDVAVLPLLEKPLRERIAEENLTEYLGIKTRNELQKKFASADRCRINPKFRDNEEALLLKINKAMSKELDGGRLDRLYALTWQRPLHHIRRQQVKQIYTQRCMALGA